MDIIFMNSENTKTSDYLRLLVNLSDKINLKWIDKYVALLNITICYTLENIKKSCRKNQFKISDIQDCFQKTWNSNR